MPEKNPTVQQELLKAFELLQKARRECGLSLRQEIEAFLKGRTTP